jgi:phosphoglucosamine mutase
MNINDGVGSECPEMVAQLVTGGHAQLGLAHDGDGDRLVVCDESGCVIEGDEVLGIIGLSWIREARLAQNTLVGTVQCNAGLEASLKRAGGHLLRTSVGDRSVTQRMFLDGLNFGGEPSGHFVLRDYLGTGDGLLAALQLLEIRHKSGISLVELRKEITLFPQSQRNVPVKDKLPLEELPDFQAGLDAILQELGDNGRVLVRYSGTEPKIRLLAEASSNTLAEQVLHSLLALARATLNIIDNNDGK